MRRTLFFAPIPVCVWALRAGVLMAIVPLLWWGFAGAFVVAGLMGWVGLPGGVLG